MNRAATAWRIRRFIDREASFLFVEPAEVAAIQEHEDATVFDASGATLPHQDAPRRCSCETLVDERCPNDPALKRLAQIVRDADFPEETPKTAEAVGLRAISRGFPLVARDDHETVERVAFLYDALYAALDAHAERSR